MNKEKASHSQSGWLYLIIDLALLGLAVYLFVTGIQDRDLLMALLGGLGTLFLFFLVLSGFFVVNPNESAVLLLFGDYKGTVRRNGFWWTNPFMRKIKVSLRARTHNTEKLKVNDSTGNPIEIAAVVVWLVEDTAQALFDVDDYVHYVDTQSEAAVRHLASAYPYDGGDGELSLRGATDEINEHLQRELRDRLALAGAKVIEARFTHLAYAPEIAGAMLQRQQASAVIAARQKIVEGAVGMVEDALRMLKEGGMVELDDERQAAMVSNLLVVLCSERAIQPVLNTGTLYH